MKPTEPTPSRWDAVLELDARWSERLRLPPTAKVRRFGESIMAERGVRHGQINIVPVDMEEHHDHGHENSHPHGPSAGHMHVIPEN